MTAQTSSNDSNKVETHPRILIQHDWALNIEQNSLPADVWLEFKHGTAGITRLTQNVHGVCSLKASTDEEAKVYRTSASDNFQSGDIDKNQRQLRIKIRDTNFRTKKAFSTTSGHEESANRSTLDPLIDVPERNKHQTKQTQASVYPHWFDISSGGVGLTALSNGEITIWDIENGEIRRKFKGHDEDAYISRFFPSDFAVVSGGADMRVKIWSLDSDNNQIHDTTLAGHRSRITDVLALDQQRVLSASNDGSVLLWDITKNEQINKLAELENNSINSISLTDSSTVACGCHDGTIRFYNLNNKNSKEILGEIKVNSPISTLCYLSELNQLVCGTEQSIIGIYDIRQLNNVPIHAWKEQRGKITSIVPHKDNGGILATTSDGSCFAYNKEELSTMSDISQYHVTDYTGADDAIMNGKIFNNRIYSICRDGFLRIYEDQN
ncbi:unnamed protein product [Adineta steineri]|uniref:Uncharacterized protein n=1 Tax=Adineta steineri TaxID=433720 RepID=A0A815EMB5_9BILA|nr:unnamed protein product [Adineta steineri]CAF3612749.1 unnamed protein product [Adineta steineri]